MKYPRLVNVDGFNIPPLFDPNIFHASCKYKPGKGQIVVATYPKCGTTWTLQIVTLILRKGVPPADGQEYFSLAPFMEMTPPYILQNLRKDGCIKTHLPFDRINFSKEAKYIYVARHPADCAVSFYHHARYFPVYFFSDGTFDDFFDAFIEGEMDFNDYFDNLLSWYQHKNEPNVLFLTYEDLKTDTRRMVLKIANFLGEEYYEKLTENDEEILKKVLECSSIEYMKDTVNTYYEQAFTREPTEEVLKWIPGIKYYALILKEAIAAGHHSVGSFIRKGAVGEGEMTLSDNQKKKLKCYIKQKCADLDVMDLWEKLMMTKI